MKKIPKTMRAAIINKYGSNDEVHIANVLIPVVRPDDVLIEVKAAGVNPLDTRTRNGKLKQLLPYTFPLIMGNDLAGVVKSIGKDVTNFKIGDEVYARTDTMRTGSFAQYIAVAAKNVSIKPKNISMEEAASLPLVALTVWQAFVEIADVKKGQKVLIHGGAGGVGSVGIQLARHLGAYVATTANKSDFAKVKKYGANEVIDYKTQDFSSKLRDYDLVLDTQGGDVLDRSMQVLRRGGLIVSINGTPDRNSAVQLSLGPIMKLVMTALSYKNNRKAKRLGITYAFHFMSPNGEQLAQIGELVESRKIKPYVDRIFPLSAVKEALEYSESGKAKGKIVIKVA